MGTSGSWEWLLDVTLILLLAATLFHALRLERALGVLKRDRAALEELVAGFNASTRQAEHGIERLRAAADGAGRQIARQVDAAGALKDDLVFLGERGERLADRLEALVRAGRDLAPDAPRIQMPESAHHGDRADFGVDDRFAPEPFRRDLPQHEPARAPRREPAPSALSPDGGAPAPRLRSQAERDLLKALRMAR